MKIALIIFAIVLVVMIYCSCRVAGDMMSEWDGNEGVTMEDMLYTVAETAKLLKTSLNSVYNLIRAGLLPVLKLGGYKVRKVALEEFLQKYEGKDLTDPRNIVDLKVGDA